MIKKTAKFFWSLRHQFAKYFIVGVGAVILDMSSLIFLKEYLHFKPFVAVIANQAFVLVFVFLMNKYWSFKEHSLTHRQLYRFAIVVIFNYCFSVSAMYIFNHKLNYDYRLVRLASIILAVSWNFFLYKYFVYASAEKIKESKEQETGV
jgi:putative flippase GtrA